MKMKIIIQNMHSFNFKLLNLLTAGKDQESKMVVSWGPCWFYISIKGCRLFYTLIWTRLGYFCSLGYINSIETSTDYRQSDIKKVIPRSSCCTSFFFLETYTTNLYSLYFELKKTKKMEIWLICCNSRLCIVS